MSTTNLDGSRIDESNEKTKRRKRGPYRRRLRVPRQTLFSKNKKSKESMLPVSRGQSDTDPNNPTINMDYQSSVLTDEGQSDTDPNDQSSALMDESPESDTYTPADNNSLDASIECSYEQPECEQELQQGKSKVDLVTTERGRLFNGSSMTTQSSIFAINSFIQKHHLSRQGQEDMIALLQCLLPSPNNLPQSLYLFRKAGAFQTDAIEKHYYCHQCYITVPNLSDTCPNTLCNVKFENSNMQYFVVIPLLPQLRRLLSRPDIIELLQYPYQRQKSNTNNIEDVYDGQVYKEALEKAQPCDMTITFNINTDGVELFNSSNFNLWPVFVMINELPPLHRKKSGNMLMVGLWFGQTKPVMSTFLKPLVDTFKILESEGISIQLPMKQDFLHVKALVICGCFDLPARALVRNAIQFNGFYGCTFCEQPGITVQTEKGGYIHVFPFNDKNPDGPHRLPSTTIEYAKRASEKNETVKGIKGPSWLSCLSSFNTVWGMSSEYMHCALQGISKLLLHLWTDTTKCLHTAHDIHLHTALIETKLKQIEVPSEIPRKPRGLDQLSNWKASEHRSWILYYAIPVLLGILSIQYVQHLALFVEALWLLLQSSISSEDLDTAERQLFHFCKDFATLYGEKHMGANVHHLLHFASSVRHLGPLWAHSAFPFENMNGKFRKLFHSSRTPQLQISRAITEFQNIQAEEHTEESSSEAIAYHEMISTTCRYSVKEKFGDIKVLGRVSLFSETDKQLTGMATGITYSRILYKGLLLGSTSYKRGCVKNDTIVSYCTNESKHEYGRVQKYASFCPQHHTCSKYCQHIAIIEPIANRKLTEVKSGGLRHISVGIPNRDDADSELEAVPVQKIVNKCVLANFNEDTARVRMFVAELPNVHEKDL